MTKSPSSKSKLPKLVVFLVHHAIVGFGLAIGYVALLLLNDVGNIASLVARDPQTGYLAVGLLTFFTGLTFGSVQMGFAVMLMVFDDDKPHKGGSVLAPMRAMPQLAPVRAKARANG